MKTVKLITEKHLEKALEYMEYLEDEVRKLSSELDGVEAKLKKVSEENKKLKEENKHLKSRNHLLSNENLALRTALQESIKIMDKAENFSKKKKCKYKNISEEVEAKFAYKIDTLV